MVDAPVDEKQVYEWLARVPDPEIPVLTITDLGIVRDVAVSKIDDADDVAVCVSLTPTYSGCPATEAIENSVVYALQDRGISAIEIKRVLTPPWTTDWISEEGREKLQRYGIAPPSRSPDVHCPRCASSNTECVSEFGSTACKASWRCRECLEPFEYFKCL